MIKYENLLGEAGDEIVLPGQLANGQSVRKASGVSDEQALDYLRKATAQMVAGWRDFIDGKPNGSISPHLTPGVAAYRFVLAKYFGEDYPRYLSLCFTPQQIKTGQQAKDSSLYNFICRAASGDEACLKSLLWQWGKSNNRKFVDVDLTAFLIVGPLGWQGSKMPLPFPASTAASLYDEFCQAGDHILDPCHGWGGDLMGFYLAAKPTHYTGIDPSPVAHEGCNLMVKTITPFVPDKKVTLLRQCIEDVKLLGKYGFAFTSPPYYDTERYDGENQSWRRYGTFDDWCEGFYLPMFRQVYKYLKPASVFAVNVGQQRYPLVTKAKELGEKAGFTLLGVRGHIVKQNAYHFTSEQRGESLVLLAKSP